MRNKLIGVLIAIMVVVIYLYWIDPTRGAVSVSNKYDGESYYVQGDFENKKHAAETIARLNSRLMYFLEHIKKKYKINDIDSKMNAGVPTPKEQMLRGIVSRVLSNYNPEVIVENNPMTSEDTSYTINKGQKLFVCLRRKDNPNKIHNLDLLTFILLHELSHMGTTTYGHNDEFWKTFKFILHEASSAGIYHPIDYRRMRMKYCGLNVDYNPLMDVTLESIWL